MGRNMNAGSGMGVADAAIRLMNKAAVLEQS
jgi:hypothetical protein